MENNKTALVIGAGSAGLIAAKELKEQGIEVKILDSNPQSAGIWSSLPWKTYTLTSSKWVTEYGCFPMPEHYPDFVTNEDMINYLDSFAKHFQLSALIDFNVRVNAIKKNSNNNFDVETDQGNYENYDFVVVCTGLHGKPSIPKFEGIDDFKGEVIHSSKYSNASDFKHKKVLCVGMGESGVGLIAELAPEIDKLVVASSGVAITPRVVKGSQNPFDQMQFWQIGRHMIGYQELLTSGLSWFYRRIPYALKKINITLNLKFYSDYGVKFEQFEQWFPHQLVPHHFHIKFWPKPMNPDVSGNLTRTTAPPDDLLYLIKTAQIIPKGSVKSFDANGVLFEDGSYEEVDTIILNTGYKPGVSSIEFPDHWQYKHLDLYKGCIHPQMTNLAFVGMVRPTVGSIPAMAEMHSRIIAAYFNKVIPMPDLEARLHIIQKDNTQHYKQCPTMHTRFPHIYFFDEWMDKMSDILDARPRLSEHLSSIKSFRAYLFGAPMPLRYRMRGIGKIANATETYKKRVDKVWGNAFGQWAATSVLIHFFTPYLLTLAVCLLCLTTFNVSLFISAGCSVVFLLLYYFVDMFRYIFEVGIARTLSIASGVFFIGRLKKQMPDYKQPTVFQRLE
jgi:dimethylaniline monooxygenase (N-oxide forming)